LRITLPYGCDTKYLGRRRYSGSAFGNPIFNHRRHSSLHRGFVYRYGISLCVDKWAQLLRHLEDLEHADPAAIAGAAASFAFAGFENSLAYLQTYRAIARVGVKIRT
jgi:hypothetical protein